MKRNIKIIIVTFFVVVIIVFIGIDSLSRFFFDYKINEIYPRFEILKLIIQVSGGLAILIGIFISIKTLSFNEKNIEHSAQTIRLAYEGLKTERLKNSIENLSNNSPETRIAGFYSLIGIAKNELTERENILNVLTSFLRTRTKNDLILSAEVQILMNLMFRLETKICFMV